MFVFRLNSFRKPQTFVKYIVVSGIKMVCLTIVAVLVSCVIGMMTFFNWCYNYWERKKIPCDKPITPFQQFFNTLKMKQSFAQYYEDYYRKARAMGYKHYGVFVLWKPLYMPIDPQIIKNILLNNFQHFSHRGFYYNKEKDPLSGNLFLIDGPEWRNLRTKLTPTFTSGKMKMMFHTLVQCGNQLKDSMDAISSLEDPLDIKDVLGRFTTDIIGSCAFGLDCNSFKNPDSDFRKYGKKMFTDDVSGILKSFLGFNWPNLARRLGVILTHQDVTNFFSNIIRETLDYREKNSVVRNDFLQLLINLQNSKSEDGSKITLTFDEIAAQSFVFFLAGYETSSTTMTFCLYELSVNPDIQEKVRKEIESVLEKYDGEITYEAIMDMKYMEQVIDEALRKYPPLPMLNRKCAEDYHIPGSDQIIEKGVQIFISTLGLHHDPEYFPDPEKFDPDRFSKENRNNIVPFTYLPFGEGPRNCIGLRFGMMQTKVGLTVLLQNYFFSLNENTVTPFRIDPVSLILSTRDKIWLNISKI